MADIFGKEKRSEVMSRIRSKNTRPERIVRSALHRIGLRFRLNRKIEGCRPDIVLVGRKTVVLVHGCFWHRHPGCKFACVPKSRVDFWKQKFRLNVERDKRFRAGLMRAGWRVILIWECETKNRSTLETKLRNLFEVSG